MEGGATPGEWGRRIGTTVRAAPLSAFLAALSSALGVVLVGAYLAGAATALSTPHSLDYVEGFLVRIAADPELLYHPIDAAPHLFTTYPPLYYALVWVLGHVVDPLVAARAVSVASAVALTGLIAVSVRRIVPGREARLAGPPAALFFLGSPVVGFWGVFARVDLLGVLFGFGAVYWYHTREGRRQLVGAGALCLLSLYTKQALLAAPAAVTVALLVEGEHRRALGFVGGVGSVGLAGLLALHGATGGRSTLHLVAYNTQPVAPVRFLLILGKFLGIHAILLGGAVVALVRLRGTPVVYRAYAAASVGVAAMALKAGSRSNFFLDPLVAAAVLSGCLLASRPVVTPAADGDGDPGGRSPTGVPATPGDRLPVPRLALAPGGASLAGRIRNGSWVATAVLALLALQLGVFAAGGAMAGLPESPDPGAETTATVLEGVEGPVLSEDPLLLRASGHPVTYQPNLMHSAVRRDRLADPVVDRIRHREYRAIVLKSSVRSDAWPHRWSRGQCRAIRRNYELVARVGTYWVYEPASRASPSSEPARRAGTTRGPDGVTPAGLRSRAGPTPAAVDTEASFINGVTGGRSGC